MSESWRRQADAAMSTLARERGKALTGYAYLLTGDLAAAEDLVQDALIKTFLRRRTALVVDAAEGYVRRAILTTFIDDGRRRRRWDERRHLLAREETADGAEASVTEHADVQAALRALSPQQRACVVLRFYDDLTVPEIADRLGLAAGTVKRYLSLAMAHLEGLLGPVAHAPDDADDVAPVIVEGAPR
jgi:RNA polymerase sigma-70 factor (ECF subfamily)